ncbi:helix-turn-helix domain-containing protein [Janibacter anophelis]
MELAGELTGRRYALGLSLRDLTAATGRSLSTLTSLEQGSAWPSWATLTDYATAVGTDIVVPGHEGEDVLLVLRRLMPRRIGESARAVAWAVGVSPTTLYARFREGGRPSSRVVLAVACDIGCPVLVTDALPAR